jgi:hypothetical protein
MGLRHAGHPLDLAVPVEHRLDLEPRGQRCVLARPLLLLVLQLRLLLLRREAHGGEGASDEEEASTARDAAADGPPGAVLRQIELHSQQPALAVARRPHQRNGQPQLHRQRVEVVDARAQHPGPHSSLPGHDVHLHLLGDVRLVQTGKLVAPRRLLLLLHESDDDRVREHGAGHRPLHEPRLQHHDMVLLDLHHVGDGADGDVLQRRPRRDRPQAEAPGEGHAQAELGELHRRLELGRSVQHDLMTVQPPDQERDLLPQESDGGDLAQHGHSHSGVGQRARLDPGEDTRSVGGAGHHGGLHGAGVARERRQFRRQHRNVNIST